MATAWDGIITAVTAAGTGTAKVAAMVAGIKTSVHAQIDARGDQDIKPQALKSLDVVLDEFVSKAASIQTALGL